MFFTQHMKMLLIVLGIVFHAELHAATIEGRVFFQNLKPLLVDPTENRYYLLIGTTQATDAVLKKLKHGDFISVEGQKTKTGNTINVESINYVGLKSLLGIWVGDDDYCYIFDSFTEFSIAPLVKGKKCTPPTTPSYTYLASPSVQSWLLLISGQRNIYVGDLTFIGPRDAQIQLFDSETGDILRTLRLRR